MQNNQYDRIKFATILCGLAENFCIELTEQNIEFRFMALLEYSTDQLNRACGWLVKNRTVTFPAMPTTKEVVDAIEAIKGPVLDDRTRANVQLDHVLIYLNKIGRAGDGKFKDPITQHLMSCKWPYKTWASTVKDSELVWFKKDFIEAYELYAKSEETLVLPDARDPRKFLTLANSSVKRLE